MNVENKLEVFKDFTFLLDFYTVKYFVVSPRYSDH